MAPHSGLIAATPGGSADAVFDTSLQQVTPTDSGSSAMLFAMPSIDRPCGVLTSAILTAREIEIDKRARRGFIISGLYLEH